MAFNSTKEAEEIVEFLKRNGLVENFLSNSYSIETSTSSIEKIDKLLPSLENTIKSNIFLNYSVAYFAQGLIDFKDTLSTTHYPNRIKNTDFMWSTRVDTTKGKMIVLQVKPDIGESSMELGLTSVAFFDPYAHINIYAKAMVRLIKQVIYIKVKQLLGSHNPIEKEEPTKFVLPDSLQVDRSNLFQDPVTKKLLRKDISPEELSTIQRNEQIRLEKERQKNDPNYGTLNLYPQRKRWQAEIMGRLIKIANRLDELEMEESDAIDGVIQLWF